LSRASAAKLRRDAGESIEDAARRELAEETALETGPGDVLGVLDDYATRSGYLMTPVVVWGAAAGGQLRRNAAEVARIHRIPLTDFDVLILPDGAYDDHIGDKLKTALDGWVKAGGVLVAIGDAVTWLQDGKHIAVACGDGSVQVWSAS